MVYKKGNIPWIKGKKMDQTHIKKLSEAQKKAWSEGKYTKKRNEKIRKSMSKLYVDRKLKIGGKKLSEHPNWKGGISFTYHTERQILMSRGKYKIWRELVFIRDDWTCQECGIKSGCGKAIILHAHHIKTWNNYPELRFTIDNGRTLCKNCHLTLHKLFKSKDTEYNMKLNKNLEVN